jgi:hypothetical protein
MPGLVLAGVKLPDTLWRGSLLPLACEAGPVATCSFFPERSHCLLLGLLRNPAGASSLATGKPPRHKYRADLVWRFPLLTRHVHDDRNPPGDPQ